MSTSNVLGVSAQALPATSGAIMLSGHVDTWMLVGFIVLGTISTVISVSYIKRYLAQR